MAARDTGGRYLPGGSGNPGGRPAIGLIHTLSGPAARRALVGLLSALGPGLHVLVLDARGLVLSDGPARRAGLDRGPDSGDDGVAEPVGASRRRRYLQVREAAEARCVAEGWARVVASGQGEPRRWVWRHPDGAEVDCMAWAAALDAEASAACETDDSGAQTAGFRDSVI